MATIRAFLEFDGALLVVADNGIFRTRDGGGLWVAVNQGLPSPRDVRVITSVGGVLLVNLRKQGIYRSTDGGDTWEPSIRASDSIMGPFTGDAVAYASLSWSGLVRSDDGGVTWSSAGLGPVTQVAIAGGLAYAAHAIGIFQSPVRETSWSSVAPRLRPIRVRAVTSSHGRIHVGGDGLFFSDDGGRSWTQTPFPEFVSTLTAEGTTLYVGTWGAGLFRSDDADATWREINDCIQANIAEDSQHRRYSVSRRVLIVGNAIYAALYHGGLYRSYDRGATWEDLSREWPEQAPTGPLAIGFFNGALYSNEHVSMMRSFDGGETWERVTGGVLDRLNVFVEFDGRWFGGGENNFIRWNEIEDMWEDASRGIPAIGEIPTKGVYPHRVYSAAVFAGSLYVGSGEHGVYQLHHVGGILVPVGLEGRTVYALHAVGNTLYAGTDQGLYRATVDIVTSVDSEGMSLFAWGDIKRNELLQNYPNPFNPETWIPFTLSEPASVTIRIYDQSGARIRTLDLGAREAGAYISREDSAYWDGRNAAGERVSSGAYVFRIDAGDLTASRRMVVAQ